MTITINGSGTITGATTMASATSFSADVTLGGAGVEILNNSGRVVVGQSGSVLQVVQATSSTQITTTSISMVTTGISASITPTSSSSKVLVIVSTQMGTTSTGGVGISIARNGTVVWNPSVNDSSGYYGMYSTASARWIGSIQYLDSPATTSSTTYAIYYAARANTAVMNEAGNTNNGGTSIILMEIAG